MTNAAESGSTNPSYDMICSLLEKSAYDPTAIPLLEAYLHAQVVEGAPYSFDANRTLAKLYLFFPQLAVDNKIEVSMALILFLALLQYPFSSDFLALSCLISERVQGKEPCTTLIRCYELLENCQFIEFWITYSQLFEPGTSSCTDTVLCEAAKSAQDKIRLSILSVLASSYREVPVSIALPFLYLADSHDLDAFRSRNEFEVSKVVEAVNESLDYIRFVPTSENTKRGRVYKESIHLESIAPLIAAAARE